MEKKWKEEGHREAEVLTPHGFVPLGDLRPGMQVCNPDGTVSKIRAIHLPGVQQMYRITMADGSSTVAGAEHLWTYRAARTRKRRKASAAKDYFDIPLDTLPHGVQRWAMDLQTKFTICDTVELKKRVDGGAESILLPQCRPQRLASKRGKWPHLSPYITGALLGDGSVTQGGVFFCSDDAEIVDRVAEELPPHLELRKHANQEGRPESWWQGGIVVRPEFQDSTLSRGDKNEGRGSGSVGGLRETAQRILERDGVFGKGAAEKFIPRWCKEGSLEDRWGVIQGLMDTDGYADDRGHCQFVSISERLALDVQWVCRSLGFRATLTSKIPTYQHDGETKEGQRAYLVQIAGNDLGRLFHLRRKKERCRTDWNGNNISDAHRVISVEPEDEMTAMCISVDHPNGLYVTDDFIVTHNSDALLMAALSYVDVPGYSALILRRTFNDLNEPGALMDRARKWLSKTDAKAVRGGREWDFPSGARLVFGHVQYHREAEEQFSGAEFQYIGIDELTRGWEERTYEFLLSRIRRPSETNSWRMQAAPDGTTLADVPLRMRSATNPGGSGHSWVKRRFINEETKGNRIFIPSLLQDNPHLNQEEYEHALMQLDPVTRERLLRGDWDIVEAGAVFSRDTFQFQMEIPTGKDVKWARCWDFAATDAGAKDEPDFTVGALVGMGPDGKWYLADIQRVQMDTDKVERLVYNTAMADGRRVPIVIEQEPGSAGKVVISHFTRNILQGWEVHGDRPTGSKSERARPWAAAASSGNFFICSNPDNPKGWVPDFFNEVELFPTPRIHDDQVDAVSGAFNWLAENRRGGGLVL
jgi:predicted phage terminase large subunit-like protein